MRKDPEPNEIYRHFKGNCYQVLCVATDSENGQRMVVYQALYAPYGIYVRPLDMFMSETDRVKYPDAKEKYRFTRIGTAGVLTDGCTGTDRKEPEGAPDDRPCDSSDAEPMKGPDVKQGRDTAQLQQDQSTAAAMQGDDQLDPQVAAFLDARTCEEKMAILDSMHERITNEMINTMAVASDLEINDGDIEERFDDLRNCLMTLGKFECDRLR